MPSLKLNIGYKEGSGEVGLHRLSVLTAEKSKVVYLLVIRNFTWLSSTLDGTKQK